MGVDPGAVVTLDDIPPGRFKDELLALAPAAQARALKWLASFDYKGIAAKRLHASPDGGIFTSDPPAPPVAASPDAMATEGASPSGEPPIAAAAVPVSTPPVYHSKPGSTKFIFLDFNGGIVTGTAWNTAEKPSFDCKPYSSDSDYENFSDSEQLDILRIWERVAEDYAPFDIDVTTEEPASAYWNAGKVAWAMITPGTDANGVELPHYGYGGIAYVDVFGYSDNLYYSPAFIMQGYMPYTAEAASHELGHNMGLSHDGTASGVEYHPGYAATSTAPSWGPIMGAPYGKDVIQWSKGEYYDANRTQDDLAIIAAKCQYRADDHGDTIATASPLPMADSVNVSGSGRVETSSDPDVFAFTTGTGTVTFGATTYKCAVGSWGSNLDIVLELQDASGAVLATNNPLTTCNASLSYAASAGIYYLVVKPTGAGDPYSQNGYTQYGALGTYTLAGTIQPVTGLMVTTPNGGESWTAGTTRAINWMSGEGGNVKIELYKGGVLNSTIVASTANDGAYDWALPGSQAGGSDYTVRITGIETPTASDDSDAPFAIAAVAAATDTPIDIPWSKNSTITSSINIPPTGSILDVNVTVNVTHTYDGDLVFTLIHPDGTRIQLANRVGSSNDNFTGTIFDQQASTSITDGSAPFTGSYQPSAGDFSTLNYKSQTGTWTLEIIDKKNGDVGTLNWWSLAIVTTDQPVVTTAAASAITPTTATSGGTVLAEGSAAVTARGVCWGTSANPTLEDNVTVDGAGTGTFTSSLAGLYPGVTYHVRAYATNAFGTRYGDDLAFTTVIPTGNGTWTNTAGGSWSAPGNWDAYTVGSGTGNTANFGTLDLTADATVTLDGARTIGHLVFGDTTASHNWIVNTGSGGPLTLAVASGTPTVTVNNRTTTLATVLAGTGGLLKDGSGTLALSGANTYTGPTTIEGGTLAISGAGQLGGGSYADTIVNNGTLVVDSTANQTLTSAISGTGGITKTGSGVLYMGGTSSYSGTTDIQANYLEVSTAALDIRNSVLNIGSGANTTRAVDIWAGDLTVRGLTGGTSSTKIVSNAGRSLVIDTPVGEFRTFAGVLQDKTWASSVTLKLIKQGEGTQTLAGTNTYTGGTTVNAGKLTISGASGTPGTGSVAIGTGAVFEWNTAAGSRTISSVNSFSGTGTFVKSGANNLVLQGSNASTFSGTVQVTGGLLILDTAAGFENGAPALDLAGGDIVLGNAFDGGTATFGDLSGSGQIRADYGNKGVTRAVSVHQTGTTVYSGSIGYTNGVRTMTLTKTGPGTLTLSGSNTYTGGTTVNDGTLLVTGSLANTTTTVAAAGTLGGTGTLAGATTVNGTLAPGAAGIGTLRVNNALALGATATAAMEVNKSGTALSADKVAGVTTLACGGKLEVTASGDALAPGDTFTLFSATTFTGGFATLDLPALPAGMDWNTSNLTVNGTISVIGTQTITFEPMPAKTVGDADFAPGATASSGLAVAYASSNPAVATIVGGMVHIVGAGTTTITASQAGDANWAAAADAEQTLTVLTKRQAWRLANFGTTENTGDAADAADPDGDQSSNFVEYALGLDPKVAGKASANAAIDVVDGYLRVSVARNPAASDAIFVVEVSPDMVGWQGTEGIDVVTVENTSSSLVVRDNTPVGDTNTPRRFIRVRVEPAP